MAGFNLARRTVFCLVFVLLSVVFTLKRNYLLQNWQPSFEDVNTITSSVDVLNRRLKWIIDENEKKYSSRGQTTSSDLQTNQDHPPRIISESDTKAYSDYIDEDYSTTNAKVRRANIKP